MEGEAAQRNPTGSNLAGSAEEPPRTTGAEPADGPLAWKKRRWIEAALILAFWTLLALLTAGNDLLDAHDRLVPGIEPRVVLRSFLRFYVWALLTPLIFWLCRRYPLEWPRLLRRALLHLGLAFAGSFVIDIFDDSLRLYLTRPPSERPSSFNPIGELFELGFLYEFVVYLAVVAAGFARDYFLRFQVRQREAVHHQTRAARLQCQLTEARLQALRMQINPHFLFNTLHAVSTLVGEDPQGVRRMIVRLSSLLRYALDKTGPQKVPLHQEMQFLETYLEIMQIRFQGRLQTHLDTDPDAEEALVPNLILQPLVENAVKHGAGETEGMGRVAVRARREGDRLVLSVRDNGPRFQLGGDPPALEEGTGLQNVRARLRELYGDSATLRFHAAPESGLIAEVDLPFHTASDLRTQTRLPQPTE